MDQKIFGNFCIRISNVTKRRMVFELKYKKFFRCRFPLGVSLLRKHSLYPRELVVF